MTTKVVAPAWGKDWKGIYHAWKHPKSQLTVCATVRAPSPQASPLPDDPSECCNRCLHETKTV